MINSASSTQLLVQVPDTMNLPVTGPVTVTASGVTAISNSDFTILQRPTFNTPSSTFGFVNSVESVSGTYYDSNTSNYEFYIDGVKYDVILSVGTNLLYFYIPPGTNTSFTYTIKYYGQVYFTGAYSIYSKLTVTVIGNGRVWDSPEGKFLCISSDPQPCIRDYIATSVLNLIPLPDTGYVFQGWNTSCIGGTGLDACGFNMNNPVTKTATFVLETSLPGYISGTSIYRSSLQGIYDYFAANGPFAPGTAIQLQSGTLNGDFSAMNGVTTTIKGGYDTGFANANNSTTTLHILNPPLTIKQGKVIFEKINIK